jgi:biopolymer transport protein ExbD
MSGFIKRKKKVRRGYNDLQFDSTSIADLSFNLLIFFIVTASFMLRQGIFLSLPSAASAVVKVEEKQIFDIYPQNDGFVFEGEKKTRTEIMTLLKLRKDSVKDTIAVIHMKPDVVYDRLIDSLSLVKESGVVKVSLKDN